MTESNQRNTQKIEKDVLSKQLHQGEMRFRDTGQRSSAGAQAFSSFYKLRQPNFSVPILVGGLGYLTGKILLSVINRYTSRCYMVVAEKNARAYHYHLHLFHFL